MNPQCVAWGAAAFSAIVAPLVLATLGERSGWPTCGPCPDLPSTAQWSRTVGGVLIGLAFVAIAAALLRWAPRRTAGGAAWPFVWLTLALMCSALAEWFEVLTLWVPGQRLFAGAQYLTTLTTALTALALFYALPRLWAPPSRSPPSAGHADTQPYLASAQTSLHVGPMKGCEHLAQCTHQVTQRLEASGEAAREALAEAERTSHLKDTFLAMVSHELRTPMQSTLYWAELIRRQSAGSELVVQASEHVIHNVKVQSRLIADLLDMSRLLTGQLRMELEPTDAVAAVRSAVQMVQAEATMRDITIAFAAPALGIQMVTDPCRLEQVAWNLVSNAVHASPNGTRVSVSMAATDQRVQLVVQDQGVGIAPHDLDHIFDTFHQGEARAVRHGGLGLGLTISQNIVEHLGGHITAHSDGLGFGACFRVDLPRQPPPTTAG